MQWVHFALLSYPTCHMRMPHVATYQKGSFFIKLQNTMSCYCSSTDLLWHLMARINNPDDQTKFNLALDECDITWHKEEGGMATHGQCRNGPKVTILSSDLICRNCSNKDPTGVYVWHQRTLRDIRKREYMATEAHGKASFLREDWNIISNTSNLSGVDWLVSIQKT